MFGNRDHVGYTFKVTPGERGFGGSRPRDAGHPARPNHGDADRRTDARQSSMEAGDRQVATMLDGQLGLPLSASNDPDHAPVSLNRPAVDQEGAA